VTQADRSHDERFVRQVQFAPLGRAGQARVREARVLLVGCGALGGVIAQTLTRCGVGQLVLVDRDIVEPSNLARQVLFDDADARDAALKVEAAERRLRQIGGPTRVTAHAEHVDASNLADLAQGCQLIVDGTDNLGTRYLINDYAVAHDVPWIYGGVVGGAGLIAAFRPNESACLRCVFPEPPPPGTLPTCETAGVILPAVSAIAAFQSGLALRVLASPEQLAHNLTELDVWNGTTRTLNVERDPNCPTCGRREFDWLEADHGDRAVVLCGRNTVQVAGNGRRLDLSALAQELDGVVHDVRLRGPMLSFSDAEHRFTLFGDGRALIQGTIEPERALALYERFISS